MWNHVLPSHSTVPPKTACPAWWAEIQPRRAVCAYHVARDGWVRKGGIWSLHEVARMRTGLNSRNIAICADGRWLAVAINLIMALPLGLPFAFTFGAWVGWLMGRADAGD